MRKGDFISPEEDRPIPRFEETLPNGVKYTVLDATPNGQFDNVGPYKVPAGHYFMMGDNRRQLHRQPRAVAALRCRVRAIRKSRGSRGDHLLLAARSTIPAPSRSPAPGLALRHSLAAASSISCGKCRPAPTRKLRDLEARIGYTIKDRALFKRALTHASVRQAVGKRRTTSGWSFWRSRARPRHRRSFERSLSAASEGDLARIFNRLVAGRDLRRSRARAGTRALAGAE